MWMSTRSSVRLKSIGSGHRELNMVISQLQDTRASAKNFMLAQNTAARDLVKWSMNNENQVIQTTFTQLAELNVLWTEVQKEFTEHLKEFIHQFEMILEGEQHVDQARSIASSCEQRESKVRRELSKASRKSNAEEIAQLETKLAQAERSRTLAQCDVVERVQENEAVKIIRVKEGLLKLSESYLELAHKCHVIFEAHRDIANEIPNVQNRDIHEIQYSGSAMAEETVRRTKERLRQYHRRSLSYLPCAPILEEPPPSYYALPGPSHSFSSDYEPRQQHGNNSSNTNPFEGEDSDDERNSGLKERLARLHL
ncbi:uncharacterized protein [Anabrus simplex]|uniref:uncharacterized protein isoform X2 n=1 Tax=Anabrus simplex TaxID=316456 RepID=UPI0034DD3B35